MPNIMGKEGKKMGQEKKIMKGSFTEQVTFETKLKGLEVDQLVQERKKAWKYEAGKCT